MERPRDVLWGPAAFVAGVGLAFSPIHISWGSLTALGILGWVSAVHDRRLALGCLCLALGGAHGERAEAERGDPTGIDPGRPVRLVGQVTGPPRSRFGEAWVPVRARHWTQGELAATAGWELAWVLPKGCAVPPVGSRAEVRGYLRRSPGYANLIPPRPGPWRLRLKSCRFLRPEGGPRGLAALGRKLRKPLEDSFEADLIPPGQALARAFLLGDPSHLPEAWQVGLRRAGLGHLLAVSGLHVGWVTLLLLSLVPARWRRLRLGWALCGLAAYLLILGPRPSALRAGGMGAVAIVSLLLRRPPQGIGALLWSAAGLLLIWPDWIADLGFQLSAGVTAGILCLEPSFRQRWTALPEVLRRPLAVTVAAQLTAMPLTLALIGGLTPSAPLLNLLAIPWMVAFLALAWIWLAFAAFTWPGEAAAGALLELLARPVAGLAALPPGPYLLWPLVLPPWIAAALTGALIAILLRPRSIPAVLLVGALLLQTGGGRPGPAPGVELLMLDVGQGDALVLRSGRRTLLIDGGGWPVAGFGARVLLPNLAAAGIRRLDGMVLTHPDRDHCGGLLDLLTYLPVAEIWMSPGWREDSCAEVLARVPGGRWRSLWAGARVDFGNWKLRVLAPEPGARRARNDRSLVLLAEAFGRRILLTGDIEAASERRLVKRWGSGLRSDVLKVAHHGSKTSTSSAFLRSVDPALALISAGRSNPYGHPSPVVLRRLSGAGVKVLRTDLSGMLRLTIDPAGHLRLRPPAPG